MGFVSIGIDVGQVRDPSAIAIVEYEAGEHRVRHLQRLPLGTPYPEQARIIGRLHRGVVARVVQQLEREQRLEQVRGELDGYLKGEDTLAVKAQDNIWVAIDITGCGRPVFDLLKERTGIPAHRMTGVTFTASDRADVWPGRSEASMGKPYLVSRLQALIQTDRILFPKTSEAKALREELKTYEIRISPDGSGVFGAFESGAHDDLATALGLAVLYDPNRFECGVL